MELSQYELLTKNRYFEPLLMNVSQPMNKAEKLALKTERRGRAWEFSRCVGWINSSLFSPSSPLFSLDLYHILSSYPLLLFSHHSPILFVTYLLLSLTLWQSLTITSLYFALSLHRRNSRVLDKNGKDKTNPHENICHTIMWGLKRCSIPSHPMPSHPIPSLPP